MKKKFRGKICAYCVEAEAKTVDHVFARKLFLEEDRTNPPKAPACGKCNEAKSKLENYVASVLPFGGRHPQAAENLLTMVPGRLDRNRRLGRALVESMQPAWLREGTGLFQRTSTFDIDIGRVEAWLKYIPRGLVWHHWQAYLRPDDSVTVMFPTETLAAYFKSLVGTWSVAKRVTNDLGRGTILYEGIQAVDPPELTVWRMSMYGGILLTGGREGPPNPIEAATEWLMITGMPPDERGG